MQVQPKPRGNSNAEAEAMAALSGEALTGEVIDRLLFHEPLYLTGGQRNPSFPKSPPRKVWKGHPDDGKTADSWLRALPQLPSKGPLPLLVDMLSEASTAGMELATMARQLGSASSSADADAVRIDLLKLKAYLTCFPAQIIIAPKTKPSYNNDGTTKRVDQVWLISN